MWVIVSTWRRDCWSSRFGCQPVQTRLRQYSDVRSGQQFTERELLALRDGNAGKLALHEILSEKLMELERAVLLDAATRGDTTAAATATTASP